MRIVDLVLHVDFVLEKLELWKPCCCCVWGWRESGRKKKEELLIVFPCHNMWLYKRINLMGVLEKWWGAREERKRAESVILLNLLLVWSLRVISPFDFDHL
jgi:hypothetical protein